MENYDELREYFVWRESGYDACKSFKTEQLAEKYANKMKYENYEIRVCYNMSRGYIKKRK